MTAGKMPIVMIVIAILALIVLLNLFYMISESEQAIITQFGKPVGGAIASAGLHVKVPFIHALHRFEKRILIWDGSADQIPTADKKYIWLDATARWKIVDPLLFYQSVGNIDGAQTRLDDIIDSASRDVISSHLLIECVRNTNKIMERRESVPEEEEGEVETVLEEIELGREVLTKEILEIARVLVPQYGIELLDVQIKRIKSMSSSRRSTNEWIRSGSGSHRSTARKVRARRRRSSERRIASSTGSIQRPTSARRRSGERRTRRRRRYTLKPTSWIPSFTRSSRH